MGKCGWINNDSSKIIGGQGDESKLSNVGAPGITPPFNQSVIISGLPYLMRKQDNLKVSVII
jgi:hypothetical protein